MKYLASDFIVVSSNPCVGPRPITTISIFLLAICTDELFSTPKIIAFLLQSKFGGEKREQESNSMPYSE